MQTTSTLINRLLARGRFRHVQVLLKVAELGSVQGAAASIGMTQPSVTQALAALEELLEVVLFKRHARGVIPTAVCLDLLPSARQMLLGIAESAEAVVAAHGQGSGVVRLLASGSAMNGILLDALPAFSRAMPHVQVQTREAESDDLLLAIARSEADVVVCRQPTVLPQGWIFTHLEDDRLAVVCSARHRLARRARPQWQDLRNERWLLSPAGSLARQAWDAMAARFDDGLRTYAVVTRSLELIVRLTEEEGLLGFVPLSFVRPSIAKGVLVELALQSAPQLPGIGVLAPESGLRAAPEALVNFLLQRQTSASSI